jgi:hypothetical protein
MHSGPGSPLRADVSQFENKDVSRKFVHCDRLVKLHDGGRRVVLAGNKCGQSSQVGRLAVVANSAPYRNRR